MSQLSRTPVEQLIDMIFGKHNSNIRKRLGEKRAIQLDFYFLQYVGAIELL